MFSWEIVAFLLIVVVCIIGFLMLPRVTQINKIKEWLVYMCYEAENLFTEPKSGKLKLRFVYDAFVNTFKWVSRIISFDAFSKLVDIALTQMKSYVSDIAQNQEVTRGDSKDDEG